MAREVEEIGSWRAGEERVERAGGRIEVGGLSIAMVAYLGNVQLFCPIFSLFSPSPPYYIYNHSSYL